MHVVTLSIMFALTNITLIFEHSLQGTDPIERLPFQILLSVAFISPSFLIPSAQTFFAVLIQKEGMKRLARILPLSLL